MNQTTSYQKKTKTIQTSPLTKHLHQEQLRTLERCAGDRLDELLDYFSLRDGRLRKAKKFYVGPCPVHGGNNNTAFNIFHEGDEVIGNWRCFTHGCHNKFQPTIIGFIRGVLSHTNLGWADNSDTDKEYSFHDTIKFLEKFCKSGATSNLDIDMEAFEKRKFSSNMSRIYAPDVPEVLYKIPREQVLSSLNIPDKYFMARGFSKEILMKYDVGLCTAKGKPMYMRATVPIYDESHSFIVGCTGRSIFEICPLCQSHHSPIEECPDQYNLWKYTKWRHNDGFKGEHHLYNYWFAKNYIAKSGIAILVESPGNVWRLEEAGFHNAVATFGAHLTDGQRAILDKSGALSLIVLTDPDAAGRLANERIRKECGNTYSLYFPQWNGGDVADTPIAQVIDKLTPIVNQAQKDLGI